MTPNVARSAALGAPAVPPARRHAPSRPLLAMLALAAAWVLVCQVRVLTAPEAVLASVAPDDAFYYLGLARNFGRLGYWSFDEGRTVTSGFHPLWAWMLAGAHAAFKPGPEAFVRSAMGLGVAAFWLSLALLWRARLGWPFLLAAALVLGTTQSFFQSLSAMEWPWVVLAAAAYTRVALQGDGGPRACAGLFVVGLLGSLARSDFGLYPAAWLLAALWARRSKGRFPWAHLAWGLVGAAAGVGVMMAHNLAYTGAPLQASALVKQVWAERGGRDPGRLVGLLAGVFPGGKGPALKAALGALFLAALLPLWGRRRLIRRALCSRPGRGPASALAGALSICAYAVLYSRSADVQPWYTANLMLPAALLLAVVFRLQAQRPRWILRLALAVLALNLAPLFRLSAMTPYPGQALVPALARSIQPQAGERWGAWDCGILGYYCDCGLVNLDGLVNNDIYPLLKTGRLAQYPRRRGLTHLLSSDCELPSHPKRGLHAPIFGPELRGLPAFPGLPPYRGCAPAPLTPPRAIPRQG